MANESETKDIKKPDAEFVNIFSKDYHIIFPDSFNIIEAATKDKYEITFFNIRPFTPDRSSLKKTDEGGFEEIREKEKDNIPCFERRFEVSIRISREIAAEMVEWFKQKQNAEGK